MVQRLDSQDVQVHPPPASLSPQLLIDALKSFNPSLPSHHAPPLAPWNPATVSQMDSALFPIQGFNEPSAFGSAAFSSWITPSAATKSSEPVRGFEFGFGLNPPVRKRSSLLTLQPRSSWSDPALLSGMEPFYPMGGSFSHTLRPPMEELRSENDVAIDDLKGSSRILQYQWNGQENFEMPSTQLEPEESLPLWANAPSHSLTSWNSVDILSGMDPIDNGRRFGSGDAPFGFESAVKAPGKR